MIIPCLGGSPGRWRPESVRLDPPLRVLRRAAAADDFLAPPILYDGLAFCTSRPLGIVALDAGSGRVVWNTKTPPGWGVCQLWQDQLLAVLRRGVLSVIDPRTGVERESHQVGALSLEYSVVIDGKIVTPLEPGVLGAWDLASHEWSWRVPSDWNVTYLSAAGDLVCVAEDHAYVGLDLKTGAEGWRFDVTEIGKHTSLMGGPRLGEIAGHAIVTEDLVYAGVSGGLLVALDARSGNVRWELRVELLSPGNFMLTPDNQFLFLTLDTLLVADASTGAEVSRHRIEDRQRVNGDGPFAPIAVAGEYVWTADSLGNILAISRAEARVAFRHKLGRRASQPPVIGDGMLLVVDDAGGLTVLAGM